MHILFTGNLLSIANDFYKKIGDNYKIVVCGKSALKDYSSSNVIPYNYQIGDDEFESIFKTFQFKNVIYMSKALDGAQKVFDELESLENALYLCKRHQVSDFIYIAANDFQEGTHQNNINSSRYILLQACEKLCSNFSQENDINITIVRVPYVYNTETFDTQIGSWIKVGVEEKTIMFPGGAGNEVDFLWDEDLGKLVSRIIDEPYNGYFEMNISGNNRMDFLELSERIEKVIPDIKFEYKNRNISIPQYSKGTRAREEFGWFPMGNLDQHLEEIVKKNKTIQKKKFQLFGGKRLKLQKFLMTAIELIFLFAVVVMLDYWVEDNSQLGFVDFRLLFVIIMGTMRGLNVGIIAAIMACFGYMGSVTTQMEWQILFYNVQNWLPFATYFLIGAISGYASDKNQDTIRFLKEEQRLIENKYILLSELYMKVLENKDEFNSQIIGYKDSYGRIYSVIKKLESTLPDHIFYEAINVLEDILENRYVVIYSVDEKSNFARLNVCSKTLSEVLEKSIKISDYSEMITTLRSGATWVNTRGLPDYPAYAMSIMREEKIVGLIFLMQVTDKQINMEFSNKFSIISGLIKDSLIRAIERMELVEKDTMLADTKILKQEMFSQVLEIKKQMQEQEFSEYLLLRLIHLNLSMSELSNIVSRQVRSNDVIGQGEDGQIYLLLSQTNKKNISSIAQRLERNGIQFEEINL